MVQTALPDYKGCPDLLNLSNPDAIREIHRRYLDAGADIITTNTLSSQRISMAANGMQDKIRELNLAGVRIAREVADEYTAMDATKPRFVVASIGPTARMASREGRYTYIALRDAYQEQMEALMEGGTDALLIETIFDMENAKAACEAARTAMDRLGTKTEIMLSMTVADNTGKTYSGHTMDDLVCLADDCDALSVGFNCSFGAEQIVPLIHELSAKTSRLVSAHPNAGLPDAAGKYSQTPDIFAQHLSPLIAQRQLSIIGGCCGTTDEHIRQLAQIIEMNQTIRH